MFTHLPLVGFWFVLIFNIFGLNKKNIELQKISLWMYAILGILAILAYTTGDGAGETVRTYPGINADIIETHEHWAQIFFSGIVLLAIAAIVGLRMSKKNENTVRKFNIYILIFSIIISFTTYETGVSGGKIRHPEIENGALKK
jgi:uncharacterized membrane protein